MSALPSGAAAGPEAVAVALLDDECKQYALVGSIRHDSGIAVAQPSRSLQSPLLLPVGFVIGRGRAHPNPAHPFARLVSDPLPPDAVREAQKQGIDHADQEFEKSELEKIPKASRTKEQADRLDKLNDMLKDYENAKKNPFANKEVFDAAEKAAEARWWQREAARQRSLGYVEAAIAYAARARRLMGGQTLPPLRASAAEPLQWPDVPAGTTGAMAPKTPGGALAQAPVGAPPTGLAGIGQSTTYVIKGTAKMGSGVAIPKGTFATGVMISRLETPEEFVKTDQIHEFGATLGGPIVKDRLWFWGTANRNQEPPPVTEVGTNGDFEFDYRVGYNYNFSKEFGVGLDYQYKTALSAGYNYGCGKSTLQHLSTGTPIPPVVIEDRTQLIKGLKPGANLWQVDDAFVSHGLGHIEGWDPWQSPNTTFNPGTWFSYKIAEADIPKFNSFGSMYFPVIGLNFGINTAPAPAWKPENWPSERTRCIPTARVTRKGGRP